MEYCIILTTCPDEKSANELASQLVKEKLAACVQLSTITSFYKWNSETHIDPEIRLVIKTKKSLYGAVEKLIKASHPYEVPQIIQTPIKTGSDEYLDWMNNNTKHL